ncbi:unnamed protein product [Merluccius merluccius]
MSLQRWLLSAVVGCALLCRPTYGQLVAERRRCAFRVSPWNLRQYRHAGAVNGSVQLCSHTQYCVGYFLLVNDQPEVDVQACNVAENPVQNAICEASSLRLKRLIKCVCNEDMCNRNVTRRPQPSQPPPTDSHTVEKVTISTIFIPGFVLFAFIMLIAVKWRHRFKECDKKTPTMLCSCRTAPTHPINGADVELQQAVGRGHFATVWRGEYKGSVVAVKVFPAGHKHKFSSEREVYELPLMEHPGIARFLGAGKSRDGGQWLMVLELASCGSLQHFLCTKRGSWIESMKLSQSLSQGLAFLHSDLHRRGLHKPAVAHRDLSSSNVLVRADGMCTLSDFGCSTILRSCSGLPGWRRPTGSTEDPRQVGSLRYMSPEILEGSVDLRSGRCLVQADVYSLGLLLWEIWMRCSDLFQDSMVPEHCLPYETELGSSVTLDQLLVHVSQMSKRPSIPKHWEWETQELVTDCWDHDPDARLTAQCVVSRLHALQTTCTL